MSDSKAISFIIFSYSLTTKSVDDASKITHQVPFMDGVVV